MAVRLALGASRARIIRQWLVEHVLLFVVASACGAALAVYGANWITNSIPVDNRQYLRNYAVLPVDRTVVIFALASGLLCGLLFGWLPGWTGAKSDLNADLRDSTARGRGARGGRLRSALVMCEVALALAILISAGLVVQTTRNMMHADVGFDARNLLTFQLSLDGQLYRTPAEIQTFYDRLTADLGEQPGIARAAAGSLVPFGTNGNAAEFFLEGQAEPAPTDTPIVSLAEVTADYAETMRLRIARGRMLAAADTVDAPRVTVINETLAARHFPNQDPIGRRVRLARGSPTLWTIVGIVADVKNFEPIDPPAPQLYVPFAQQPRRSMTVVVRSSQDPATVVSLVRGAVAALDPAEPIAELVTMEERIHRVTGPFETMSSSSCSSARSRCSLPESASTVLCRIRSRSARGKSAFASRSARAVRMWPVSC
jgi:putative ABC transport system permease protein